MKFILIMASVFLFSACSHNQATRYKGLRYPTSVIKSSIQECEDISVKVGMLDNLYFDNKISDVDRMSKREPLFDKYNDLGCGKNGTIPEFNLVRACAELRDEIASINNEYFINKMNNHDRIKRSELIFKEYERLECRK